MGKADTRFGDGRRPSEGACSAHVAAVRRRQHDIDAGGWCILRTNGRRTLKLAQTLNATGIEAWSPKEVRQRRLPRSRSFREYDEAIVPSFVFVRAAQLADVLRAHALPVSPHPPFTVFSYAGRAPVIADSQMGQLRHREHLAHVAHEAAQERARQKARRALRRDVAVGAAVRLTEGAYAGITGEIVKISGDQVTMELPGAFRVAVASWLLLSAEVEGEPVLTDVAA